MEKLAAFGVHYMANRALKCRLTALICRPPSAQPVYTAVDVKEEDMATILYTSGTTGRPKVYRTCSMCSHTVMHVSLTRRYTQGLQCT